MGKSLLSIDWDYFICIKNKHYFGSYIENKRTIVDLWYKRYIQEKEQGKDIQDYFYLFPEVECFWSKMKKIFQFDKNIKVYVSDSHAFSYKIAKENHCNKVYLFDAHADLGYGGISSLDFEVNCANWLGKLLKDKIIKEANIIYSPFTKEKISDFDAMNQKFPINYFTIEDMDQKIPLSFIHICRSGAWTPPWLDNKFRKFIQDLQLPYTKINFPYRKWDVEHINFSDKIQYKLA